MKEILHDYYYYVASAKKVKSILAKGIEFKEGNELVLFDNVELAELVAHNELELTHIAVFIIIDVGITGVTKREPLLLDVTGNYYTIKNGKIEPKYLHHLGNRIVELEFVKNLARKMTLKQVTN